ncbi:tyrosine-type recombinase/integrase [Carnobacterium pleistocenium]|uniref:tyrosine-type recombinase/integrase n=1 Tax=Carnobacterium pleistocenium TaxID=181073 RepID=UPI000552346F|nr:tyrosine-type recombinase/integrase [Carnobacterium pleistocenium]
MGKRRLNGSIEAIEKDKYRLRVTVGYNPKGNPIRKSKTITAKSEKKAEKMLIDFIHLLEKDNYLSFTEMKFEDFVYKEWYPNYAKKEYSYHTSTGYKEELEHYFMPTLGYKKLKEIKPIHLKKIVDDQTRYDGKKQPLSRSSQTKRFSAIKSVFKFANDYQFLNNNPLDKVSLAKNRSLEIKGVGYYTLEEIPLLIKALDNEREELQLIVLIALVTGARRGEIAALESKHINSQTNSITFEQMIIDEKSKGATLHHTTKTGVAKTVSVPQDLITKIKLFDDKRKHDLAAVSIKPKRDFLFCNANGDAKLASGISRIWKRFLKRNNLRHIRFHDLRHTNASWLLSQNVNIKVIQERLGHSDIQTSMNVYTHVQKEMDQNASATFDAFFK